jgi:hypothetical protein
MEKFNVKSFSWKFAGIVFAAIVTFDIVSEFLVLAGPDHESWREWSVAVLFWIVNFPALPFIHYVRDSSGGTTIVAAVLAVCSFNAILWSVAAGYFFAHKLTPNKALQATAAAPGS